MEGLEDAMTTVVGKMAICGFYVRIYADTLKASLPANQDFHQFINQALPEFHASILVFLIKSRKHFDPLISGRIYKHSCYPLELISNIFASFENWKFF